MHLPPPAHDVIQDIVRRMTHETDEKDDPQWTDRATVLRTPRCAACDASPDFCAEHFGAVFDLPFRLRSTKETSRTRRSRSGRSR